MSYFDFHHGVSWGYYIDAETGRIVHRGHSFSYFGLYPVDLKISAPEINTSAIYVPGMDGKIDTTQALDGVVHFKNRMADFRFKQLDASRDWSSVYHELLHYLHGRIQPIVLDDDPNGYYVGRWSADKPQQKKRGDVVYFTVRGDLEPYQYGFLSTGEPWLWAPFRFTADSIRRPYYDIKIFGTDYEDNQYLITSPTAESAVGRYIAVADPGVQNPKFNRWYEYDDDDYVLTEDIVPEEGKTYFAYERSENLILTSEMAVIPNIVITGPVGAYTAVDSPSGNPKTRGWYEESFNGYVLTNDTSVADDKTYYTYSSYYTAVGSPSGNPKTSGYYENIGNERIGDWYVLTEDTEVVSGKTYYTYSGSITGLKVKYTNSGGAVVEKTVPIGERDATAILSDLIIGTMIKDDVELSMKLVGENLTATDYAEIKVDYRTGRL